MLGHHRQTSETPFKWRFAGGPMVARLLWHLDPLSPHHLKNTQMNKNCCCFLSKLDPFKNLLVPCM